MLENICLQNVTSRLYIKKKALLTLIQKLLAFQEYNYRLPVLGVMEFKTGVCAAE